MCFFKFYPEGSHEIAHSKIVILTILQYVDAKAWLNKQRVFVLRTPLHFYRPVTILTIFAVSLPHCNDLVTELGRFFRVCVALFCSPLESFLFVVTASHFRPRELLVPFPYSRSVAGSTPIPPATPNFLMRFGYIHVYRPSCQDVTAVHHPVTAIVRASPPSFVSPFTEALNCCPF